MLKKEENNSEVESILFSSGRWMSIDELSSLTRSSTKDIKKALKELKKRYDDNSSLVLIEEGDQWKLTVKQRYADLVSKVVSQTELPKSVMETLAVIAFKYPILQSEVIKIRTSKAYDHLHELEDKGYIARERYGRTKKIKLTQKFFEYFDIPEGKVRDVFARFDAVEKSIEKQEKENDENKKEMDKKQSDAQNEIDKAKERVGPLETYDTVADKVGVDPEQVADSDLDVDISLARAPKGEKQKLEEALSNLNQIDGDDTGDDSEDVPIDSETDNSEEEPKDQDPETDEEDIPEDEPMEDGSNIDPFFDNEGEIKIVNEEKEDSPEESVEDSNEDKPLPKPEDIFSNPDLDDESLNDKDKESKTLLDSVYDDIEKSKDELSGKMKKDFKPR